MGEDEIQSSAEGSALEKEGEEQAGGGEPGEDEHCELEAGGRQEKDGTRVGL